MNWLISRDTDKIGLPAQVSFWGDWKDVKGIEGRKYSPFTCLIYLSALKEMVYLAEEIKRELTITNLPIKKDIRL